MIIQFAPFVSFIITFDGDSMEPCVSPVPYHAIDSGVQGKDCIDLLYYKFEPMITFFSFAEGESGSKAAKPHHC
jgi:hypothetical protein